MDMTIKTENSLEDYVSFQKLLGKLFSSRLYGILAAFLLIVPLVLAVYVAASMGGRKYVYYALAFLAVWGWLYVAMGRYHTNRYYRLLRRIYPATAVHLLKIGIGEKGITVEDAFSNETTAWGAYHDILEDEKNMYLLTKYGGVLVIPKSNIPGGYEALMTEIRARIGS